MIEASDMTLVEMWPAASLFLFCEPAEQFWPITAPFSETSLVAINRLISEGWTGFCVGNESNYEWLAIRHWLRKLPRQDYASSETVFCQLYNNADAVMRIVLFAKVSDRSDFYQMLVRLPQRIHLAVGAATIEPVEEFAQMLAGLNVGQHRRYPKRDHPRLITFSDTPHADRIKILAALSRGNADPTG